jgi:hypothetical protein
VVRFGICFKDSAYWVFFVVERLDMSEEQGGETRITSRFFDGAKIIDS